ncbi:MAG: transposase [Pseudonocardiaceae bacterium]
MVPGDLGGGCGRYLSLEEREEIALGRAGGSSIRVIAARLGRAPSTVSREVRRNRTVRQTGRGEGSCSGIRYRAGLAQAKAEERARRPKPRKPATNAALCAGGCCVVRRGGSLDPSGGLVRWPGSAR